MRGERRLLHLGEYLIGRACRDLPRGIRDERYREWAAELPAILDDPDTRFAPRRAARMLRYAAGTFRGTLAPGSHERRQMDRWTALLGALIISGVVSTVGDVWAITQAPGQWMTYLQLAWGLLQVALPMSMLVRASLRTTLLIGASGLLAGAVVNISIAMGAPGDWVSYFGVAFFAPAPIGATCLLMWVRRHPRRA
jgi:hypothetical protein